MASLPPRIGKLGCGQPLCGGRALGPGGLDEPPALAASCLERRRSVGVGPGQDEYRLTAGVLFQGVGHGAEACLEAWSR